VSLPLCSPSDASTSGLEWKELDGQETVSVMINQSRLRWSEHVECKDDTDWVRCGKLKKLDTGDPRRPHKIVGLYQRRHGKLRPVPTECVV